MSKMKIALGMLVMFTVQLVAEALLPGSGHAAAWSLAQSALVFFIAALVGGWLAGRRFLLPAVATWLLIWVAIVYLLYRIAAPAGPVSIVGMLQYNWVDLILSGCSTVAGALCGQMLRQHSSSAAAAT